MLWLPILADEKRDTRNKSTEFMENWNNYASVKIPPERIREPEQICCDTGSRTRSVVGGATYLEVRHKSLENLKKTEEKKKCNIVTECRFKPMYSSFPVENATSEPPGATATGTQNQSIL